jgi:hypothetical protein
MRIRSLGRRIGVGVLAALVLAASPKDSRASDILFPGFDLFDPMAGSQVFFPGFGLFDFIGVPLESFDFGSGPVPTGETDTIVQRLHSATGPGTVSIIVRLLAMQMVSTTPIDLGFGSDFHYLTLQAAPSRGMLQWTEEPGLHGPPPPAHGVAHYEPLNWRYDVHLGSLGGPVVQSDSKILTSSPTPWSHFAPPDALLIPGVNSSLNGADNTSDFFFIKQFSLTNADGTRIIASTAPEPATFGLMGVGIAGLAVRRRRRRRQY